MNVVALDINFWLTNTQVIISLSLSEELQLVNFALRLDGLDFNSEVAFKNPV